MFMHYCASPSVQTVIIIIDEKKHISKKQNYTTVPESVSISELPQKSEFARRFLVCCGVNSGSWHLFTHLESGC